MNKIYKVVWSKVKNCYVVVSEVAKANGKSGVKSIAVAAAVAVMMSGTALAAEYTDRQVVDGGSYDGKSFTVTSTGVNYGGAIYNTGTLTINNSELNGNVLAENSNYCYGGAIYNANGAELNITDTNFEYNKTQNTLSKNGQGGAIYNAGGELTISGGTFKGNIAQAVTAAGDIQFAMGGAIYNGGDGSLSVTGTTFEENKGNEGGAIVTNGGPTVITDSTFKNNVATMGGGAINIQPNKTVVLNGTNTFENNEAVEGGAVKLYNNSVLDINGTATFSGNTANGVANDIYNDGIVNINEDAVATLNGGMVGTGTTNVNGTLVLGADAEMGTLGGTQGVLQAVDGVDVTVTMTGDDEKAGSALTNKELTVSGVDLVLETKKTAIYNQDLTLKSDSDVTIKSQAQGISAYGEIDIEAENVTIESVDNGIQSVADANPNDVGNVSIKANDKVSITATTEGYAVTNVSKNGGVIDIEGTDVTLVSENRTAVKVGHEVGETGYNGTLNVTGNTITIEGAAQDPANGNERKGSAVYAQSGTLNLNATDKLTITDTANVGGNAIGVYDGGSFEATAGEGGVEVSGKVHATGAGSNITVAATEGDVAIDGQVDAWQQTTVDISGKNVTLANDGADTVRGVGATININADEDIVIETVEKDGIQACASDITLTAKNVVVDADAWGINVTGDAGSDVVINAENVKITGEGAEDGDMGGIRNLGASEVTVAATGTTIVVGDILASGGGTINVDFKGEESFLDGNVTTVGDATTNLSFTDGATWTVNGATQSAVSNLDMQGGNLDITNAVENAVLVDNLTGTAMNVKVDNLAEGTVVVDHEKSADMTVSVSTTEQVRGMEGAKEAQGVVKFDGENGVDVIEAQNNYIVGDVTYDLENEKVTTTLDTDLNVTGTINGVDITNAAGLDREATSQYYQSTTIEGKTKIDSMGRVYTNHVFADQAIIVGDHSTLDRTGLYVGENFKVDKETGNVTAGTINGAQISEYKVNGVVLDKDGDVYAKDIMTTGTITSIGKMTAMDGLKVQTSGEGSFSFANIGTGETLFYAMSTDPSKANPTIVMNAQNGNIETQGSLSVAGGAFVVNGVADPTTGAEVGDVSLAGSLAVGGDAAVAGGLNVGTDVVANGVSLNETAQQVAANKDAIAQETADRVAADEALQSQVDANKEAIALNDRVNQVQNTQIAQLQSKDLELESAIEANTEAIEANKQAIAQETADRVAADEALQSQVDANKEAIALNDRVNQVQNKQIAELQSNGLELSKDIEANKEAIAQETADRVAADEALQTQIDTNASNIAANAKDIVDMKAVDVELGNNIAKNASDIAQNKADIETNAANIATNAQGIEQNRNAIAGLGQSVSRLDGRLDKVGAGAAALAALHPLDYDSENKLSFSAGVGNYAGETAAAVGAFYRPNEDVMLSIGGTAGNGENMVNMGVSFAIGKGSSGVAKMSKAELVQEVTNMKAENEELKQENKDIRHELNKLKELVMKLAEK